MVEIASPELSWNALPSCDARVSGAVQYEFSRHLPTQTRIGQETPEQVLGSGAGFTVRMSTPAHSSSLRMHRLRVRIKLGLERLLRLLAVRTMTASPGLERYGRAECAVCLDRDIAQPFGNAQSWLLQGLIFA